MNDPVSPRTIFALSSGQPPAALAVVRISGPEATAALKLLARRLPQPRHASLASLRDPQTGDILDRALVLVFPGPATATGEDLVELHLHGGQAVVRAVEGALSRIEGLRKAEPGEFTRRAFENGRLDLVEAEGLADLLTAETESQRRNAMALAEGTVSRAIAGWRAALVDMAAAVEARIDFADEDDVPDDDGVFHDEIASIVTAMDRMLAVPPAERLRDGIRVAIGGRPNVGKSTLLNALVGREAAIATPIPGTTRDLIECPVQLGGLAFLFIDTAGLRETGDEVERIGVERAERAIDSADLLLWLDDPALCPDRSRAILLHPRCDEAGRASPGGDFDLAISARSGIGMKELVQLLVSRGTELLPREGEVALLERQRHALSDSVEALRPALHTNEILLLAESLRAARAALDRLTGDGGIDPLFDAIFSRFCIGK